MTAVARLPDSSPKVGRIGRYQLIRRLAVGGMAEIFLARLPGLGIEGFEKLVVLKRILPQHALDPELVRMFADEARLSATLSHPNVTEVHDVGNDGDTPFFAMEYVHGANLREVQRAHGSRQTAPDGAPLPLGEAVGILAAAAAGLHYAHERLGPGGEPLGIVHRDVSPSNILVSYDGAVKVSDFGIAKWTFQRTRTQEGTLKGKLGYMSPEQCRGQTVDRRSDVFALGAILYEMTTGVPAFAAGTDLEILNQIASGVARPPCWPEGGEPYPPALSEIVMRALAPDPAERFPTMQTFQLALEAFARGAGLNVSTGSLGTFMQRLFATEIAAWRAAEQEGKSLGDHLAARTAAPTAADPADRTATDVHIRAKSGGRGVPWRGAIATGAFLTLSAIAGGWITHRMTKPERRPGTVVGSADRPAPLDPPPSVAAAPPVLAGRAPAAPPAASTSTKTRARPRAPAPEPVAAPPTSESRLRTWDPDSPLPP